MNESRQAFIVGITTLIMMIVTAGLLFWKSNVALSIKGYELKGTFDTVNGMIPGAPVRFRGYRIGRVFDVSPGDNEIIVTFKVNNDLKIPEGSRLEVTFDGLIGERFLIIVPPDIPSGGYLREGATMKGESNAGLAKFVDVGTENLAVTKEMLESIQAGLEQGEIEDTLAETIYNFRTMVRNMSEVTDYMREFTKQDDIKSIVNSLGEVAQTLERISKRIETQILTDSAAAKFDQSLTNFVTFSEDLNQFSQTLNSYLSGNGESGSGSSTMSFLRTINTMQVIPGGLVEYSPGTSTPYYLINVDWDFGDTYFRTGFGDRITGTDELLNIQYGVDLNDSISTRLGLFYTEPGLGLDYQANDYWEFELEAFNLEEMEMNITSKLKLRDHVYGIINLKQDPDIKNKYNNYAFGFSYDF